MELINHPESLTKFRDKKYTDINITWKRKFIKVDF